MDAPSEPLLRERVRAKISQELGPVRDHLLAISQAKPAAAARRCLHSLDLALDSLTPPDLKDATSFRQSLDQWLDAFAGKGLQVHWRALGLWPTWSLPQAEEIFHMICEACGNAMKHGQATRANLLIRSWPGGSDVTLSDNGQGFPPHLLSQDDPALTSLRRRANTCQFSLKIGNLTGGGSFLNLYSETLATHPPSHPPQKSAFTLGQEIHDNFCQRVVGVLIDLELSRTLLPEESSASWLRFQAAEDLLRELHFSVRACSHHLTAQGTLPDSWAPRRSAPSRDE